VQGWGGGSGFGLARRLFLRGCGVKRHSNKTFKRTSTGVCRDCKARAEVAHAEWHRAAGPRCPGCGGVMERLTPRPWLRRGADGALRKVGR
jgi:hypothetical protein